MDLYLAPQLKNAKEIKNILKEAEFTWQLPDGRDVETLMVYLPIKAGNTDHSDFFREVEKSLLANFVFECSEIERKLGISSQESPQSLLKKAIRKLSQHTAKGELGELLLFTILDVYFEAPKLLSKVSMKTSRRMPVYGADAVHGRFKNNEFKLYLGESKLHANFKGAAGEAALSIKNAEEKYEDEFDLLDSHMDFPNMEEELVEKLLEILNPYSGHDLTKIISSPCFIGFSEPDLISHDDFIEKYKEIASHYITDFFTKVEKKGTSINRTALLMLPFTCVDVFVNEFISYMDIKT